jgi:hypothetical protein
MTVFVIDILTCFEERIPQAPDVVNRVREGGLIIAAKDRKIRGTWTAWMLKLCDRSGCRFKWPILVSTLMERGTR